VFVIPPARQRPSSIAGVVWHELENVYVADGSVFVSLGGFNPTLTIMALSLRMARRLGRG
jgi:choline dehydrogenase-like flavoprotein